MLDEAEHPRYLGAIAVPLERWGLGVAPATPKRSPQTPAVDLIHERLAVMLA
jgi:hypothetical protein